MCKSGQPAPSKNLSVHHVNQTFNQEVQLDYKYRNIRDTKHVLLHIVDGGTAYSETIIAQDRRMETATMKIEEIWLNRNCVPKMMSSEDEFVATNKKKLGDFLGSRDITFKLRTVRRQKKLRIEKRKHGTMDKVLERLHYERTKASDKLILSRSTFLNKVFSHIHILSSFELVKCFIPSILGMKAQLFTEELLIVHSEEQAT